MRQTEFLVEEGCCRCCQAQHKPGEQPQPAMSDLEENDAQPEGEEEGQEQEGGETEEGQEQDGENGEEGQQENSDEGGSQAAKVSECSTPRARTHTSPPSAHTRTCADSRSAAGQGHHRAIALIAGANGQRNLLRLHHVHTEEQVGDGVRERETV